MMMTMVRRRWMSAMFGATLAAAMVPAQAAGLIDSLFGNKTDLGPPTQREWRLDEFTTARLVAKEVGAPANQHPAAVDAAALRTRLAAIETTTRAGRTEPLFDDDELGALVPVLVRALSLATPNDDLLLLSTARRGGTVVVPMGLTARLFVQGDALQLLVHDARLDFIEAFRTTHVMPRFEYGSRSKKGSNELRSAAASSKRADWLAVPLASLGAAAVPATPAPAPAAAAAPIRPVAAGPVAAPAPAAAALPAPTAPVPGSAAAIGAEVEQHLITLKRLRDKGLISEDEYQQKRREILQRL